MIPKILFEDTHLVVISKPAGLLSQGESTGDENVVDWMRSYVGRNYVGLVHRLDRNTSGLMVIAKRSKSAERLTTALQAGELKRSYLALLSGKLVAPARWSHHLLKDEKTNTVRAVASHVVGAKEAALRVEPLGTRDYRGTPITLARFELETGRSHQIRAQASKEGYPLIGDSKYGGPALHSRPALHSAHLIFPHPKTLELMTFDDPLPDDLAQIWEASR